MNREEPPKDNVSLLLGSLIRPIGRGVPGKGEENETVAVKCHDSAFSPAETHACQGPEALRGFPECCWLPAVEAVEAQSLQGD